MSRSNEVVKAEQRDSAASTRPRCNDLNGKEWLRYSVSVWSDIRKTPEEVALKHPAMFPQMLCERLMQMFLRRDGAQRILDPFAGSGSTLLAVKHLGKSGIGLEISEEYIELAQQRLAQPDDDASSQTEIQIVNADARDLLNHVAPNSIDLCITSPPYWNILNRKRTADAKEIRHYGNLAGDLGVISDYEEFLEGLVDVFTQVYEVLRDGAYCIVVVMDLRKKNRFFPLHAHLAERLKDLGYLYDDLIIWDRGQEYNNLRPLGYPSVFRVNKVHEFILIFRKPRA